MALLIDETWSQVSKKEEQVEEEPMLPDVLEAESKERIKKSQVKGKKKITVDAS